MKLFECKFIITLKITDKFLKPYHFLFKVVIFQKLCLYKEIWGLHRTTFQPFKLSNRSKIHQIFKSWNIKNRPVKILQNIKILLELLNLTISRFFKWNINWHVQKNIYMVWYISNCTCLRMKYFIYVYLRRQREREWSLVASVTYSHTWDAFRSGNVSCDDCSSSWLWCMCTPHVSLWLIDGCQKN